MKLNRVLIVYKKSSFAIYAKERQDKRIKQLIEKNSPAVRFMVKGHQNHEQTLKDVQSIFHKRKIAFKLMYRAAYFHEEGWDMVLSVGGDGTFMEAAHRLKKVPLLGLNSRISRSLPAGSLYRHAPRICERQVSIV